MKRYWTCSKFADWLRGTPSLNAGTSEEWNAWTTRAKQKKFRYWLTETGLDKLQDIVTFVPDQLNNVRYYLNNRYSVQTHALVSNLPRGKYYDFSERLLHSAFDELVNFVEIEKAWMHIGWGDGNKNDYNFPWWRGQWYTNWFKRWRSAEAGLDYLRWEMSLKIDVNYAGKNSPDLGQPTHQAINAKEIYQLYFWWKHERPGRNDPYIISGWSAYCDEKHSDDLAFFDTKNSDKERTSQMLEMIHALEKEYDDEDEKMLIRLIKIRQSLWT